MDTIPDLETRAKSSLESFGAEVAEVGEPENIEDVDAVVIPVKINGDLLLSDVLDYNGRLLYCKEGVEIKLRGFRDDRVLLRAAPL